jgi:CheY-like chemotaxis protein
MKVLSVDDDQDILLVLSAALRNMGYEDVTCVSSGRAALDTIQNTQDQFDCFLLDIQMPQMDGVELCAQIRANPRYKFTPIIMLTAKSDGDSLDHAFAAGATDYVTKPFDLNDLNERLTNADAGRDNKGQQPKVQKPKTVSKFVEPTSIDLLAPLQLLNVTGMVSTLAMHNYLDQLYRSRDEDVLAVCIRVANSAELQQSMSSGDFYRMLSNVAEAVTLNQKNSIRLMSHSGGGDLVVILHKSSRFDRTQAKLGIDKALEDQRNSDDIVLAPSITCLVGRPVDVDDYPDSPSDLLSAATNAFD